MTTCDTSFLDLVATPVVWLSQTGLTVMGLNPAAGRLFGAYRPPFPTADLWGEALTATLAPPQPGTVAQATVAQAADLACGNVASGTVAAGDRAVETRRVEADCETRSGRRRLAFAVMPTPEAGCGFIVSVEDISPVVLDGSERSAWRATLLDVLQHLPVGLEIYDEGLTELFSNDESSALFGYTTEEIRGLYDWWETGYPDPVYRERVRQAWDEAVAQSRIAQSDIAMQDLIVTCKDGSRKIVQFRYRAIGDHHALLYWDVTERRRLEEDLRRAAETDPLTGVSDRRRFFGRAADALAEGEAMGRPLSLLMVDIDHFKRINDRFGHAAGDEVLRAAARRMAEAVRLEDTVGRFGGEEFAVLLPGLDRPAAAAVAERLRAVTADPPVEIGEIRIAISISIGGVTHVGGPVRLDALLERADHALYDAKRAGRDRVVFLEVDL
jgi:diguanylate cyclase (GGDEF)-like protein